MGKGQVQVGQRDKHIAEPQYVSKHSDLMSRPHQTGLDHKRSDLNCSGFLKRVILLLPGLSVCSADGVLWCCIFGMGSFTA